jgi:hypothetical protein
MMRQHIERLTWSSNTMRLIAFILIGWLTLPANAQTCGESGFACKPEVLQALKVCEQYYRMGGDWLNPTYNDPRCRRLWEKWFEDLVRIAAHQNEQDRNRERDHGRPLGEALR